GGAGEWVAAAAGGVSGRCGSGGARRGHPGPARTGRDRDGRRRVRRGRTGLLRIGRRTAVAWRGRGGQAMGGPKGRTPAVLAVDPVGRLVHAATDRGDRLRIPLILRAAGDRLIVVQDGPGDAPDAGPADPAAPAPIALWDWIDRPALVVGTALWTVEEALAAMLAAVDARTGAGPGTRRVLVVPATFGAVRRARVAAAAGAGWLLCDSAAAAVLGARPRPGGRRAGPPEPQVVVEDLGDGRVHALVVTDPWTGDTDGRRARPVAAPWGRV